MLLTLSNKNRIRRTLKLSGPVPAVFGIVNLTPDSFSDGGRYPDAASAAAEAIRMLDAGAAGVDLGAESTRPGAKEVPSSVEIKRLLPVIDAILKQRPDAIISVDTRKSAVAKAVLNAGADIINDVSGLRFDLAMAETIASFDAAVVLMHSRGTPETMRDPEIMKYSDVVSEVANALEQLQDDAIYAGIRSDSILLDPGLGFAKTPEQDCALIRNAAPLRKHLHAPLFYGPSRKSFLKTVVPDRIASERDFATAGVLCALAAANVEIVRVHNVSAALDAMKAFFASC